MNYYLSLAITLLGYMTCWFLVSLIKKRNDVADIAWGLGFIVLTWMSFYLSQNNSLRGLLVGVLVTIWGVRLAVHIFLRNKGKQEDYRYVEWRKRWGNLFYIRSYMQVYLLQGVFLYLISLPILFINQNTGGTFGILDIVGVFIWIVGFYIETTADMQLTRFIHNPQNKGKIMDKGLWRYSRHPNYFGEVVQWWGIWMLALVTPIGFFTIIGPLTITYLILFVSGVPLHENKYEGRYDYEQYKKRTSKFFPLPPRSNNTH